MKCWPLLFIALSATSVLAETGGVTLQCSNFKLELIPNSMFKVNGQFVTSQKVTVLGQEKNGVKIDMGLMPAQDGNNYGFQYIHRPGSEKRFLNVQLLQNSMDAPKIIGSFPCRKSID